jgi:glycosyltransferase involved in cell wall biosynthesis
MSAVESMAAGKPVIGCAEGGLLETIQDQITGLLINSPPQVADLIQAIQKLDPEKALSMRANCEGWAATFSTQNFITGMQEFIKKHHG